MSKYQSIQMERKINLLYFKILKITTVNVFLPYNLFYEQKIEINIKPCSYYVAEGFRANFRRSIQNNLSFASE